MRRLLIAIALAALAASSVTPAHAESYRGADPTGDVWRLTAAGDGDDYTAAPTRANPDITRAVVRHGRSRVVLDVRFDDIFVPPGRVGRLYVSGEVRTDGRGASFDMTASQRHRQGRVTIFQRGQRCVGTSRIDYVRDRVRVVLPRQCLADPAWVSVSLEAWSVDGTYVWEDNAFQRGFLRDRYTPRLAAG